MNQLFASGHAIDLVIAVLCIEALVLWGPMRRGAALLPLPNLLAGLGLLLAWRLAQGGAPWTWTALALTASGLSHGWDLWQRWHRPPAR